MKIANGIVDTAIQQIIPIANTKARPRHTMTAEYITVHNTANPGATARQNADYVVNQNEYKSWHFTVGNNEIYQHLPINESGWHSGDGENGTGNRKSIGIEIAEVYGANRTAVKFIAELLRTLNISIDKVVSHKHWSGKNCPRLILPYWDSFIADIKKEMGVPMVTYKTYGTRIHELKGEPLNLTARIVDKRIWDITNVTNCTNGSFYWYDDEGRTYATSPLVVDGTVHQRFCNHEKPQSVFVIYKDGTVELQRVTDVYHLKDFYNIKLAIGGVGLRNTQDKNFRYSPVSEGFEGKYADVLRIANKTVLGYSKTLNKVYLLVVKNASHGELLRIISDNSSGEAYDIAVSLDGGGSTFMDALGKYVFEGNNQRRIHNIIGFF
jgi:hypothetical protein